MGKTTKAISTVTIMLLLSKSLGFVREIIIAAYYGATYQTDAYNMALRIIELLIIVLAAGASTVIIPMYHEKLVENGKSSADLFVNSIITITTVLCTAVTILCIVAAPILVKAVAPGFSSDVAELTVNITRIMLVSVIFTNLSGFLCSVAKLNDKFAITVIVGYPASIITIIMTVFFAKYIGIYALVVSSTLFALIEVPILIVSLKNIFKLKVTFYIPKSDLIKLIKLSIPIYIGAGLWEVSVVIEKILASGLSEGSISAMSYASKLRELPNSILTTVIITVVFPMLSKNAADKDYSSLRTSVSNAISYLFIILLPVIAICVFYSKEITKIIFERGAFTADVTALTSTLFAASIISLIFSVGLSVVSNAFYSIQDMKTPQISKAIAVACNIIAAFLLVKRYNAIGLMIASSGAIFVNFLILFIQFWRRLGGLNIMKFVKDIIKCAVSMICMIPFFYLFEILRNHLPLFIFVACSTIVSFCIYGLLLYLLKVELFQNALRQINGIIRKKIQKM